MSEGLDPMGCLASCLLSPGSVDKAANETGAAASEVLTGAADVNTFLDFIRAA
ncbi:MAG: hypothetical protein J0H42_21015 [Rhizobiales bacterium]|nr:hypothetical protein [Hyphomicrobiales bacterium]